MDPTNGFAKSHLGFILKTDHLRYVEAIPLLREGISSGHAGADDGRFYFHLGDALTRVGKPDEVFLQQFYLFFYFSSLILWYQTAVC